MKNQKNILRIVAAISLAGTLALGQGSLTPSGAPSETMKTLQQVEPRVDVATLPGDAASEFIINDAGSYYLSSSMEVTKTYGILINSTDVTLDLNGF